MQDDSFIPPELSDPCGHHLAWRDLLVCGETVHSIGIANFPKERDSYAAIEALAVHILDPVIDRFGPIRMTYGFCSAGLRKHIPGRIAPELDQHCAHERKRGGSPICGRLGAAADFIADGQDMREIAHWIIAELSFDRLYYYGAARPINATSYGPEHKREVVAMPERNGRRVPRVVRPGSDLPDG